MNIAEARLLSTFTFVMQDIYRQIIVLITTLQDTVRKINILTIHEEILIQQPHLLQGFTTYHTESTAHNLYLCRLIPWKITHVIMTETAMLRKPAAQPHHLIESHHRRRQSSPTLRSWFAIGSQHPYTQSTGIRMRTHKTDSILENMLADNGIRIQQRTRSLSLLRIARLLARANPLLCVQATTWRLGYREAGKHCSRYSIVPS